MHTMKITRGRVQGYALFCSVKIQECIILAPEACCKLLRGCSAYQISEQSIDSTSSSEGTITISLPGLPDGVNVTRSRDTFFVNDGRTFLERNETRVSVYMIAVSTSLYPMQLTCILAVDMLNGDKLAESQMGLKSVTGQANIVQTILFTLHQVEVQPTFCLPDQDGWSRRVQRVLAGCGFTRLQHRRSNPRGGH